MSGGVSVRVYVCVWGGGRVCACTCVSYLHSLLTPIRKLSSIDHLVLFYMLPQQ